MKNYHSGFIGIVLVIVVALAVAGGGYYWYGVNNAGITVEEAPETQLETEAAVTPTTTTVTATTSATSPVGTVNVSVTTDLATTNNCSGANCFEQKFAACQPATTNVDAEGIAAVEYKIIGPASGGCQISFKYTKNPNPDWENKELTCVINNSASFQQSSQTLMTGIFDGSANCRGPLLEVIQSM